MESITEKLKDATFDDVLINAKFDNDLYRLVYILKELVEANGIYKLDVLYCDKSLVKENNGKYGITISDEDSNTIYYRYYVNEEELIKSIKELIGDYYNRNQWIMTRCMTSTSLAEYWQSMYKLKLDCKKEVKE